jgi:integrase
MATHNIHKLRWSKVQTLTKNGKYGDGGNLWLQVTNNGAGKSWVLRWTEPVTGRERSMGLGSANTYDLEEAREKARECRKLLDAGKDPKVERDGVRLDQLHAKGLVKTVNQVRDEFFDQMIAPLSRDRHKNFQYMMKNYVRPKIGDMPIEKIDTNTILDDTGVGLRKLWTEKNRTAREVRSFLERIFSLAITNGYYTRGKNPAAWKDHLKNSLGRSSNIHTVTHHPSLPYKDVPRLWAYLQNWEDPSNRRRGRTALVLLIQFIILTCVRTNEARLATWDQIDTERMIWTVPTGRKGNTKRKDERQVAREIPITPLMQAVLDEMRKKGIDQSPKAFVFPSPTNPHGGPHNQGSCAQFVQQTLKWETLFHMHGFRSTLRDWCRANGYSPHLWEIQVDHQLGDKTSQSYGHDPMFEQRRQMMTAWGEYCARPVPPATNVAQINEARKRRAS